MDIFRNIDFTNVDVVSVLGQPGIFAIHCKVVGRTLLVETPNVLSEMTDVYESLTEGDFKHERIAHNEKLLSDYKEYGRLGFTFGAIVAGPEWENPQKRKDLLDSLKASWPYPLY